MYMCRISNILLVYKFSGHLGHVWLRKPSSNFASKFWGKIWVKCTQRIVPSAKRRLHCTVSANAALLLLFIHG